MSDRSGGGRAPPDPGTDPSIGRVARALGVAAGTVGLAGCASSDEDRPGTETPPPADAPGDGGTPTAAASPTPADRPEPSPSATEGVDLSSAECAAEADELAASLDIARAGLERVRAEQEQLRAVAERLQVERDVFAPKPEAVVEAAGEVGRQVRDAVVFLDVGGGQATGWFVDARHVVTNAHNVVDDADGSIRGAPTIWTLGGDRVGSTVVDYEPSLAPDVAVLEADAPAPATLALADAPASAGDVVVQVGNPGSVGNWVISVGEVTDVREVYTESGAIEELVSDVPGAAGVSGSPVVTLDGAVVGMTSGGSDRDQLQPGERPVPHPSILYDRQLAVRAEAQHVPLAAIRERYDEWV